MMMFNSLFLILITNLHRLNVVAVEAPYANTSTPLRESMRGKFNDIQITIMTFVYQDEYMSTQVREFEKLTGAKVNKITTDLDTTYADVQEDIKGGGLIDLYTLLGNWVPSFAAEYGLLDITDFVANQPGLDWFDIMPALRKGVASYEEKIYTVPIDGDVIIMLYRSDLVEKVGLPTPRTWDDVLEITEYYKDKDINNDGTPDFANCFSSATKDIGMNIFWAFASSFLQTRGTTEGIFFNPESFDPKSNDPAFLEALEIYKKLVQSSPFREFGPTAWQDTLPIFEQGRCVLWYNYPGPTRILVSNQEKNNMTGVLNYAEMPGMKCEDTLKCPFAKDGVNFAPFLAGGGQGLSVSARSPPKVQEAAIAFAFYIADPAVGFWDVAFPGSFLDPYRQRLTVALSNPNSPESKAFLGFGWEERQLEMIKEVTENSFITDNYVKDLRILGAYEYTETATMPHLLQMWNNEASAEETAQIITSAWNAVTEKYGVDKQRDMYRSTLGLQPYVDPNDDYTTITIAVSVTFSILIIVLCLVSLKLRNTIKYKTRETANAPKGGDIAIIFTDVEGSTSLWDASKQIMSKALDIHHETIRRLIQKYSAYEVKTIGDCFMIAVGNADSALMLVNEIQEELLKATWPVELASLPSSCVEFFPISSQNKSEDAFVRKKMFAGLRVRIGMHLGNKEDGDIDVAYDPVTKGYDYYGQASNAAARIEALGFGGQTIISQALYDKATDAVKKKCSILPLGEVELRGVSKEVYLYQCLPHSLKGRRFGGVLRQRNSLGESEIVVEDNTDFKIYESSDRHADIMSLTPVQLQSTVARLRKLVSKLENELVSSKSNQMSIGHNTSTITEVDQNGGHENSTGEED